MADKKKEDLRIIRTRKLLSNTILDMMETNSIEKISVIDLCNKAMVNRATFYAHFEDKYHLLDYALEELKDTIYEKFTKTNKTTSPIETINLIMSLVVDFIFGQQSHIYNIISHNRNGQIIETITKSLAASIKYQLAKFKDTYDIKIPLSICAAFIAGGIMNVALFEIDNPGKYTKEEFKKYCSSNLVEPYFSPKKTY